MPNYQNGKIYKIISFDNPDICYIGSTVQTLCKRFGGHVANYKQYLKADKTKKYTTSCKMVCYPDARIYLIEQYPCDNKSELERREGQIIKEYMKDDDLENPVNCFIAGRTKKEYYIDNQNEIKERTKHYHINNYDKVKERVKQYHINNKETINEKRKIKVNCEYCDKCVRKQDIKRHHRTIRCQSFQ